MILIDFISENEKLTLEKIEMKKLNILLKVLYVVQWKRSGSPVIRVRNSESLAPVTCPFKASALVQWIGILDKTI